MGESPYPMKIHWWIPWKIPWYIPWYIPEFPYPLIPWKSHEIRWSIPISQHFSAPGAVVHPRGEVGGSKRWPWSDHFRKNHGRSPAKIGIWLAKTGKNRWFQQPKLTILPEMLIFRCFGVIIQDSSKQGELWHDLSGTKRRSTIRIDSRAILVRLKLKLVLPLNIGVLCKIPHHPILSNIVKPANGGRIWIKKTIVRPWVWPTDFRSMDEAQSKPCCRLI